MVSDFSRTLVLPISDAFTAIVVFLPRLISGLVILLIGLLVGAFIKQLVLGVFKISGIRGLFKKYEVPESKEGISWESILAELIRWFVIVLFLIPASDTWGLGRFVDVLNNLVAYLPNVFVSILILLIGFIVSKLVFDVIIASIHGFSKDLARTIATVGKYSVLVFTTLIVLNQLGVASDLVRIIFSGIVAMLALAGGLAFGLGGKEVAGRILGLME